MIMTTTMMLNTERRDLLEITTQVQQHDARYLYSKRDNGRDHERRTRFVNESRGPRMNDSALLLHYYYYYYYAVDGAISGAEGLTFVRAPDRTGSVRSTGSRRRRWLPTVVHTYYTAKQTNTTKSLPLDEVIYEKLFRKQGSPVRHSSSIVYNGGAGLLFFGGSPRHVNQSSLVRRTGPKCARETGAAKNSFCARPPAA